MARAAEHPSGPKVTTCVRLSPWHLTRLKALAVQYGLKPNAVIARLIERANLKEVP